MGGITITPHASINDVVFNKGDILILPGADTWFEEITKTSSILSRNF